LLSPLFMRNKTKIVRPRKPFWIIRHEDKSKGSVIARTRFLTIAASV
jgi:hypothetical protein